MHEAHVVQGRRPERALGERGPPGGGLDEVEEDVREPSCDPACVTDEDLRGPTDWGTTVGVGPWTGPWPEDPRFDPHLLADGDRRNVVDRYRYWTVEAIVADLDRRRHPFHVAIENFGHDLNIGTVVRTANAFLAAEVHIVGRRRWNRRGAMVTDRYQHVRHHADVAGLLGVRGGARACRSSAWTTTRRRPAGDRRAARAAACCCSARRGPG